MPSVKRSVHARKKRRKVLGQAKGYWGLKKSSYRYAKEQVEHSLAYAYRDRKNKKRTFRRLWIIRINAAARQNGLSYNQFMAGLREGGDPARPQGARGARRERSAGVRRDRRAGEVRARSTSQGLTQQREVFEEQARQCAGRSPLYEDLCRRFARDAAVATIVGGEPEWDAPLRLLGGLHFLVLAGDASWDDPVETHAEFLREFVREQSVQTNEVQRSWMLLPCFLRAAQLLAVSEFDVVELGPSAGLNLAWDGYRYAYAAGEWGPVDAALR